MNGTKGWLYFRRRALFGAGWAFCLLLSGCVSRPPVLSPPSRLESLEGYGSFSLRGAERSGRARFSFMMNAKGEGRIEVFNPFGKSLYHILFREENSYLIVPSKKIYWEGGAGEVAEKFLGFRLTAVEVSSLLSGRWEGAPAGPGACGSLAGWQLERDRLNRVLRGRREDFVFEIKEFFGETSVPRRASFSDPGGTGSLKVLKIRFNTPFRQSALSLSVLETYEPKTWAELQNLLDHED
jgi:hypothetical protein